MDKKTVSHMDAIRNISKKVAWSTKALIRLLGGNLEKEAHEGEPAAQFVADTAELNHYMGLLFVVEQKLAVTKKTAARRKLERQKMLIQQEIHFYKERQQAIAEGKEPKE